MEEEEEKRVEDTGRGMSKRTRKDSHLWMSRERGIYVVLESESMEHQSGESMRRRELVDCHLPSVEEEQEVRQS